ncbi:MAG: TIGR00153 family protein [Nitrospinae bacterium]|nr:TIGR00153 family protein [Nitrospinota bacterium]
MRSIFSMFAKSPFKPLTSHMDKVRDCVDQVKPLFAAQLSGDYDQVQKISEKIVQQEYEADKIKNEIRDHLPQSIFLAVDKRDFNHLLSAQDDIADAIEDLTVILRIRRLSNPDILREPLKLLVDHVVMSAHSACDLIHELENLLEASFGGVEAEKVEKACHQLATYEWEADKMQFTLAQKLFSLGDALPAGDLLLWNEVNKKLGAVADNSELIGKTLKIFLAK